LNEISKGGDKMTYKKKSFPRGQRKSLKKENGKMPLQNVVSFKINDQEKKLLENLTQSTSKSVSDIMREALNVWKSKRARLCLEG